MTEGTRCFNAIEAIARKPALVALSSAVLVARASAEDVKNRLIRAEQDVRILVNGPWPPYTFATVV